MGGWEQAECWRKAAGAQMWGGQEVGSEGTYGTGFGGTWAQI